MLVLITHDYPSVKEKIKWQLAVLEQGFEFFSLCMVNLPGGYNDQCLVSPNSISSKPR